MVSTMTAEQILSVDISERLPLLQELQQYKVSAMWLVSSNSVTSAIMDRSLLALLRFLALPYTDLRTIQTQQQFTEELRTTLQLRPCWVIPASGFLVISMETMHWQH